MVMPLQMVQVTFQITITRAIKRFGDIGGLSAEDDRRLLVILLRGNLVKLIILLPPYL